jgi:hypothetical protein
MAVVAGSVLILINAPLGHYLVAQFEKCSSEQPRRTGRTALWSVQRLLPIALNLRLQ